MRFPDSARAIPGRPIPPTWLELERWVDGLPGESVTGSGVSISEWPDGRDIHFNGASEPWRYPFKVAISGTRASIRPGLLNLVMPRILPLPGESGDPAGLYLDGTDLTGAETGARPTLEVLGESGGPGPDGRSFVCLAAVVDVATGALKPVDGVPEDAPKAYEVTVEHRPELPDGFHHGGMPEILTGADSLGLFPLAILYWDATGTAVRRHFQIVQHNLSHRYQLGAELSAEPGARGPGRHWFFGVT